MNTLFSNESGLVCSIDKALAKEQAQTLKKHLLAKHDITLGSSLAHHAIARFYNSPGWGHFSAKPSLVNECKPDDFIEFILDKTKNDNLNQPAQNIIQLHGASLNINQLHTCINTIFFPFLVNCSIKDVIREVSVNTNILVVEHDEKNNLTEYFFAEFENHVLDGISFNIFNINEVPDGEDWQNYHLIMYSDTINFHPGVKNQDYCQPLVHALTYFIDKFPLNEVVILPFSEYAELDYVKEGLHSDIDYYFDEFKPTDTKSLATFIGEITSRQYREMSGACFYKAEIEKLSHKLLNERIEKMAKEIHQEIKDECKGWSLVGHESDLITVNHKEHGHIMIVKESMYNSGGYSVKDEVNLFLTLLYEKDGDGLFFEDTCDLICKTGEPETPHLKKVRALCHEAKQLTDKHKAILIHQDQDTAEINLYIFDDNEEWFLFIFNAREAKFMKEYPEAISCTQEKLTTEIIINNILNGVRWLPL